MITKTFHDIFDVLELASMVKDVSFNFDMINGRPFITIMNTPDGGHNDYIKIDDDTMIPAWHENVERVYRALEEKIASGSWEKSDDRA